MNVKKRTVAKLAELLVGEVGREIVEYLLDKGESTDEEISKDLSVQIGVVRKSLYGLHDKNIVSSRLERNSATGWITYYWYVPLDQIDGIIYNIKRRIMERLEARLEYESKNVFYWCGNKNCPKLTFSEAVDGLFRCPVCGRHLKPHDNSKLIAALKWTLSELKSEVEKSFVR